MKERARAWAEDVAARLRELGCDAQPGEVSASPGEERALVAPVDPSGVLRAWIALSIAPERVEVAVELAPTEVDAARKRLADPVRALELTTALQALPEQFTMGVGAELEVAPVAGAAASTDPLRALLDRVEREQRPLRLGWSVPRETAVAHAALLDELLEDAAVALGPVLVLLASPADAPGIVARRPLGARRERADRGRGDDDRVAAKRRAKARRRDPDGDERSDADAERRSDRSDAKGGESASPPGARSPGAKAGARPGQVRAAVRGGVVRQGRPARAPGRSAIEKGAHVRVLEGPFAGKVGVVQELDGKGGARVMLGLLAVRIAVEDLARSVGGGRGRPLLSTSHRKPVPVRS